MGEYDETPDETGHMLHEWAEQRDRQHPGRLLRHHAGPHPPRRRGGRGADAAPDPRAADGHAPGRPGAVRAGVLIPAGVTSHRDPLTEIGSRLAPSGDERNATLFVNIGERTNVTGSAQVPQADRRRRLSRRAVASRASRSRPAPRCSTSTWTRACSTAPAAMVTFLNLIAAEPDIARVPMMIDSLQVGGDRGRAEVRAGQGDRQLDLA